jgi:hypothetical protein
MTTLDRTHAPPSAISAALHGRTKRITRHRSGTGHDVAKRT